MIIALWWFGVAAAALGVLTFVCGRGSWAVNGWFAVANVLLMAAHALAHQRIPAGAHAALLAGALWLWWRKGGGDGTKRRLKSLARRFRGVRRTAPVMGGAS